jgi:hypothetical protein
VVVSRRERDEERPVRGVGRAAELAGVERREHGRQVVGEAVVEDLAGVGEESSPRGHLDRFGGRRVEPRLGPRAGAVDRLGVGLGSGRRERPVTAGADDGVGTVGAREQRPACPVTERLAGSDPDLAGLDSLGGRATEDERP